MRHWILTLLVVAACFLSLVSAAMAGESLVKYTKYGKSGADGAAADHIWFDGVGEPPAALGKDGDYYIDMGTNQVYLKTGTIWSTAGTVQGPKGPQGPAAPDGIDGANGIIWTIEDAGPPGVPPAGDTGTGTPSPSSTGENGDFWAIKRDWNGYTAWTIWEKANGAWELQGNIKGNKGPAGVPGFDSPDGIPIWYRGSGPPVPNNSNTSGTPDPSNPIAKSYYLDRSNGEVWYLASASGLWSNMGSLSGRAGPDAAAPTDGVQWFREQGPPTQAGLAAVLASAKTGDYYLDLENEILYRYSGSGWTEIGKQGPHWYTEAGNPNDATFETHAGDYWVETSTNQLWKKGAAGWQTIAQLKGPPGDPATLVPGEEGPRGPPGYQGYTWPDWVPWDNNYWFFTARFGGDEGTLGPFFGDEQGPYTFPSSSPSTSAGQINTAGTQTRYPVGIDNSTTTFGAGNDYYFTHYDLFTRSPAYDSTGGKIMTGLAVFGDTINSPGVTFGYQFRLSDNTVGTELQVPSNSKVLVAFTEHSDGGGKRVIAPLKSPRARIRRVRIEGRQKSTEDTAGPNDPRQNVLLKTDITALFRGEAPEQLLSDTESSENASSILGTKDKGLVVIADVYNTHVRAPVCPNTQDANYVARDNVNNRSGTQDPIPLAGFDLLMSIENTFYMLCGFNLQRDRQFKVRYAPIGLAASLASDLQGKGQGYVLGARTEAINPFLSVELCHTFMFDDFTLGARGAHVYVDPAPYLTYNKPNGGAPLHLNIQPENAGSAQWGQTENVEVEGAATNALLADMYGMPMNIGRLSGNVLSGSPINTDQQLLSQDEAQSPQETSVFERWWDGMWKVVGPRLPEKEPWATNDVYTVLKNEDATSMEAAPTQRHSSQNDPFMTSNDDTTLTARHYPEYNYICPIVPQADLASYHGNLARYNTNPNTMQDSATNGDSADPDFCTYAEGITHSNTGFTSETTISTGPGTAQIVPAGRRPRPVLGGTTVPIGMRNMADIWFLTGWEDPSDYPGMPNYVNDYNISTRTVVNAGDVRRETVVDPREKVAIGNYRGAGGTWDPHAWLFGYYCKGADARYEDDTSDGYDPVFAETGYSFYYKWKLKSDQSNFKSGSFLLGPEATATNQTFEDTASTISDANMAVEWPSTLNRWWGANLNTYFRQVWGDKWRNTYGGFIVPGTYIWDGYVTKGKNLITVSGTVSRGTFNKAQESLFFNPGDENHTAVFRTKNIDPIPLVPCLDAWAVMRALNMNYGIRSSFEAWRRGYASFFFSS